MAMNRYAISSVLTWPRVYTWVKGVAPLPVLLAGALSPAGASTPDKEPFLAHSTNDVELPTTLHTLEEGESVQSVAQDYNVSLEDLRKLNALNNVAHGFEQLQTGDALIVPLKPLPADPLASKATPTRLQDDSSSQTIARLAARTAPFLSQHQTRDASITAARRMALNSASGTFEQWFSQWGTARVRADADKHLALKSAQVDVLVPLWERQDGVVFTQGGIHHTDERTQLNLGVGTRYFANSAMFGGNSFLDTDLSHGHRRLGFGVEYWRNFLKIAINSYWRLSNWKAPNGRSNYQERPANGWDVRAEAYLPRWPQLGGELVYEQYYGKRVVLFGKEHQQNNPHAVIVGASYTPIPLVTLSADQRQGKAGEGDTRLGIQLNYQLGVPWERQINPDNVSAMRSLAKGRYDLVERNNNLVLEYRRKAGMYLNMTRHVVGFPGERKTINVVVSASQSPTHVDWWAPELFAAGGSIIAHGVGTYTIALPAYQEGERAINTYSVSAVAVDSLGNRSNQGNTQVSVNAPMNDVQSSGFSPVESQLPADGRRKKILTLFLRDGQQRPLDRPASAIRLIVKGARSASVSAFTRKAAGVYQVTVQAGSDEETLTLIPWLGNQRLRTARVYITRADPDAAHSTVTATPSAITANGVARAFFSFSALDAKGNAIGGIADRLSFYVEDSKGTRPSAGKVMVSAVSESRTKGRYTATLAGTQAGRYTVRPQFNGVDIDRLSTSVELYPDTASARVEKLSVDKSLLMGDGIDYVRYTATVSDAYGNPVPNAIVQWRPAFGQLSANSTLTSAKGEARVSFKTTDKGKVTVSASTNRSNATDSSVKVIGLVEDSWNIAGNGAIYHSRPVRGHPSLGFVAKAPTRGPRQLVWGAESYEPLMATLTNETNENRYVVTFRAYRQSGCKLRAFNAAINCPVTGNGTRAKLLFVADDNASLPSGRYLGDIHFSGKTWHDDYEAEYLLHIALRVANEQPVPLRKKGVADALSTPVSQVFPQATVPETSVSSPRAHHPPCKNRLMALPVRPPAAGWCRGSLHARLSHSD